MTPSRLVDCPVISVVGMFAQDRLVALEATLAGTIAQMQAMQLQKEELQQMLQQAQVSIYSMSAAKCCLKTGNNRSNCHCSTSSGSLLQSRESAGRESASSTDVDCGLPISISLEGKQRQLSAEEIACMPVQEFATLWTVSCIANLQRLESCHMLHQIWLVALHSDIHCL